MASPAPVPTRIRFDAFELDARSGELRKSGILLRLQPQPFRLLFLLIDHAGQVVTREEIQRSLWVDSTFVDFDHGINYSINQIRSALADNAEKPRYIETLTKRGYRFIGTVEQAPNGSGKEATKEGIEPAVPHSPKRTRRIYIIALSGIAIMATLIAFAIRSVRGHRTQPTEASTIKSLAVLPIATLSGDVEKDYFSDGMTDAVITDLGQIGSLRVISRTSVMGYKNTNKPLSQIARELNVDAFVEGSVTRSGERVRITANLVQASPERHLWSQTYERDMRDVLALQDEVAHGIAQEIRLHLTPQEHALLTNARPVNPESYELYLHGRYFLETGYPVDWTKSGPYFEQAIAKDPSYAPAYVGLAGFYLMQAENQPLTSREPWVKAEAAVERALQIDDTLSDAHLVIAGIRLDRERNWTAAEREYKRAIALNPNSAIAHKSYAWYLLFVNRQDQAIQEGKFALELDPLQVNLNVGLGDMYSYARLYEESIAQYKKTLELAPNSAEAHGGLFDDYRAKEMYKDAAVEFLESLNLSHESAWANAFQRDFEDHGYKAAIQLFYKRFVAEYRKRPNALPYDLAGAYAQLGRTDQAFESLDEAFAEYCGALKLVRLEPNFDSLRSDPRYADLVRRIGFPQ
jgi:TolB-like protein/DNA-binding winged helix-turn-helix (wHTH) protein/Tfp pilus assembly protein PilF